MASVSVVFRETIPSRFFSSDPTELHDLLGGPALFFLEGVRSPPLLISTLLHGNEHSGFLALREWLRPYALGTRELPRSVWLMIGNTAAAAKNLRHLAEQPDFNRIWRKASLPEAQLVKEVLDRVTQTEIFAAIDIHNNTGRNPHYACVPRWERRHLQLAALFGRIVVHAEQPIETFTHALSDFCPSVTVECGLSGETTGISHVRKFLDACLHLSTFPAHSVSPHDIDGFQTVAQIKIRTGVSFSFSSDDESSELRLRNDLDSLNFSELPVGTLLGHYRGTTPPLLVRNPAGSDPGVLSFIGGEIRNTRVIYPSMFTLSRRAILEDCLGYLMVPKGIGTELP